MTFDKNGICKQCETTHEDTFGDCPEASSRSCYEKERSIYDDE